jgi:hypothetical protein
MDSSTNCAFVGLQCLAEAKQGSSFGIASILQVRTALLPPTRGMSLFGAE